MDRCISPRAGTRAQAELFKENIAHRPKSKARGLHGTVAIQQQWPNGGEARFLVEKTNHAGQGMINDNRVAIEQQDVSAAARRHPGVARPRKARIPSHLDQAHA